MHAVKSNKLTSIVVSDQHTFSLTLLKLLFHNPPLFNELQDGPPRESSQPSWKKKKKVSGCRGSSWLTSFAGAWELKVSSRVTSGGKAATANRFNLSLLCDNKAKGKSRAGSWFSARRHAGLAAECYAASCFSCTSFISTTSAGDTIGSIFNGAQKLPVGIEQRTEVWV